MAISPILLVAWQAHISVSDTSHVFTSLEHYLPAVNGLLFNTLLCGSGIDWAFNTYLMYAHRRFTRIGIPSYRSRDLPTFVFQDAAYSAYLQDNDRVYIKNFLE